MDSFIVKQLHTHLRIPAAFCILMSCEAELHCKIEHISPRFCKSSIPRCIHGDTPLLFWTWQKKFLPPHYHESFLTRKKTALHHVAPKVRWKFWIYTACHDHYEKLTLPECCGDQIRTGVLRHPVSYNLTRIQIKNHAEKQPISIDSKICKIADPYLIRMIRRKAPFQYVPLALFCRFL